MQALLRECGAPSVQRLDREVLLADVLGTNRAWLFAHAETRVSDDAANAYRVALARSDHGEPIAYIVGHREFWSLRLEVTPDTLIPRPETEHLVERALSLATGRVADLGTGSGAIAIAIKHDNPKLSVVATDLSSAAVAVARRNAHRLQAEIDFRVGSWCKPLKTEQYDVIVSNPPYVEATDTIITTTLRFEPASALAAGDDGLDDLRAIIAQARKHLFPGGHLLVEHGATQAAAVRALFCECGYTAVETGRDFAGHERFTQGAWDPPSGRRPTQGQ